jgi:hypothetical protein
VAETGRGDVETVGRGRIATVEPVVLAEVVVVVFVVLVLGPGRGGTSGAIRGDVVVVVFVVVLVVNVEPRRGGVLAVVEVVFVGRLRVFVLVVTTGVFVFEPLFVVVLEGSMRTFMCDGGVDVVTAFAPFALGEAFPDVAEAEMFPLVRTVVLDGPGRLKPMPGNDERTFRTG